MESDDDRELLREERAIYTLLVGVGLLVVVRFAFNAGAVTGGVTLCSVMIGLGIAGFFASRRRSRLPSARTLGRR